MVDRRECNEEESQNIVDFYLRGKVKITSIHKISSDYYLSCSTPYLKNEDMTCNFRYKEYSNNKICLFEVWKNSRIYSLTDVKVSEEFNNACEKAIKEYEEKRSLNFPEGLLFGKEEEDSRAKELKIILNVTLACLLFIICLVLIICVILCG